MSLEEEILLTAEKQRGSDHRVLVHDGNPGSYHVVFSRDPGYSLPYMWELRRYCDDRDEIVAKGAAQTLQDAAADAYRAWLRHTAPVSIDAWDVAKLIPRDQVEAISREVYGDDCL